jgi:hypothetical protein
MSDLPSGHRGDVGIEIAPETADDPALAARVDDLLHRTCDLSRALTGAEQAALKVDLDGERRPYGLLQLSDKAGGEDFSPDDATRLLRLAAFAGATLDALRLAAAARAPAAQR